MPALIDLVVAPPVAAHGVPTQLVSGTGQWRFVVELADPSEGSSTVWHDITCIDAANCAVLGYELTRGASEYGGRWSASIAELELMARDDVLAPWNDDTSSLFGYHIDLGAGLLVRAGFIRVNNNAVVAWYPRFTHRVETWGDATFARGQVRRHRLTTRDLMTNLVDVTIPPLASIEWWGNRVEQILSQADWPFGSDVYGAVSALSMPILADETIAVSELDASTDPAGAVWYTARTGRIIARPALGDTWNQSEIDGGATGTMYPDGPPVVFSYLACDDGNVAYATTDVAQPFGFDDTEVVVVNSLRVVDDDDPDNPYAIDNPVSVARYGVKPRQYGWRVANDDVADSILAYRAFATVQARPLTTTIDLDNFFPGAAQLDYLSPITIKHVTAEGRETVEGTGAVRSITERVRPRIPEQSIEWDMTVIADIETIVRTPWLLPVENLTVFDVTDQSASFSWTLPGGQPMTPTELQVRMSTSTVWLDLPYPSTSFGWANLLDDHSYEFNVRIVRRVDGRIVAVSPTRTVGFTTLETTNPTPGPDPEVPPGPCPKEWEIQEADASTAIWEQIWTTIQSGTLPAGVTTIPDDPSWYQPGKAYRTRVRDVCPDEDPGLWDYGDSWVLGCQTHNEYPDGSNFPLDDPLLLAYWPQFCEPDGVFNAVTGTPADKGPAYGGVFAPGTDEYALRTPGDTAGVVIYGEDPALSNYGSTAIAIRVSLGLLTEQITLFSIPGFRLRASPFGGGWVPEASLTTYQGGSNASVTGPEQSFVDVVDLMAAYDELTGTITLYVNGTSAGTDTAENSGDRAHSGPEFAISLPEASWATHAAVWDDHVVAPIEPTGPPDLKFYGEIFYDEPSMLGVAGHMHASGIYVHLTHGSADGYSIIDTFDPFDFECVGSFTDSTNFVNPGPFVLEGSYSYVSMMDGGIAIVDHTVKTNPQIVGSAAGPPNVITGWVTDGAAKIGNYFYKTCQVFGDWGIATFDVSDPANPSYEGFTQVGGVEPLCLTAIPSNNGLAAVDNENNRFITYSTTDPTAPSYEASITSLQDFDNKYTIEAQGDYAVTVGTNRLIIVDCSFLSAPIKVGEITTGLFGVRAVVIGDDGYAYVTRAGDNYTIAAIDISDPTAPTIVNTYSAFPNVVTPLAQADDRVYTQAGSAVQAFTNDDAPFPSWLPDLDYYYVWSADRLIAHLSDQDALVGVSSRWRDYIEGARLSTPADAVFHASHVGLGNTPAIQILNSEDRIIANRIEFAHPYTILVVIDFPDPGSRGRIISGDGPVIQYDFPDDWYLQAGGASVSGGLKSAGPHTFCATFHSDGEAELRVDGIVEIAKGGSGLVAGIAPLDIFAVSDDSTNYDLPNSLTAFVAVVPGNARTHANWSTFASYISSKYGIAI